MYHIAHSVALTEYLITLWFKPTIKAHVYVTAVGEPCGPQDRSVLTRI